MEVLRYAAFTSDPAGGNPAGVVLDATGASDAELQEIARQVGYSETAFLLPHLGAVMGVRYFSPLAEVPFCGHATIATAVAYAERHGPGRLDLDTAAGRVVVTTRAGAVGPEATLVSVRPSVAELPEDPLAELLRALRWEPGDLDPALPVRVGYAGAFHPILAARTRQRSIRFVEVLKPEDFDAAFAALRRMPVDGLIVMTDQVTQIRGDDIVRFATEMKLATVFGGPARRFVAAGGLISWSADSLAYWRQAATYVDKILRGATPATLPVEQPTTFELVVNLRTAKALGLTLPPSLLLRADEVIE